MNASTWMAAVVACAVAADGAGAAGPGAKGDGAPRAANRLIYVPTAGTSTDGPTPYSEKFDAYAAGSGIAGQGGWEIWYTGGGDANVVGPTPPAAASAPNKLRLVTGSDVVQRFTIDGGQWVFRVKTYVPSSAPPGIGGAVIFLNQYGGPQPDNWSVQLHMNETTFYPGSQQVPYMIESQWDGGVLPLVLDQWIEVRSEIDLDNDQVTHFYNNQQLGLPHLWTDNNFASGPGITSIAALDLWSSGTNEMYFDDISLIEVAACYPDCNGVGGLTIADFGCFQTRFVAGDPYADCNGVGGLTIADFGCFQTRFVAGCP